MAESSRSLCNTKPIADMSREELVGELYWNSGGDRRDFIAATMTLRQKPTYLRSPVCIGLFGENAGDGFEDDELQSLVEISRIRAEKHMSNLLLRNILISDNLHIIRKYQTGNWSWRQLSWDDYATLYFDSLTELKTTILKDCNPIFESTKHVSLS